jgi:alkaline phosphatase D
MFLSLMFLSFPVLLAAGEPDGVLPTDAPVRRIAFGSCAHQDKPQPIWDVIATAEPDLLLLGDNVYADSSDPQRIRAAYKKLGQ